MSIDQRWIVPIALICGVAAAVTLASQARRYRRTQVQDPEKAELQAWESEGGNAAAPSPVAPA